MERTTRSHRDAALNARTWDVIVSSRNPTPRPLNWLFRPAPGPGPELLGDVRGATVAELGCGQGRHLASLAECGIDRGIGIDVSPVRLGDAAFTFVDVDQVEWWLGDAVTAAAHLPDLDVAFSVFGAMWFADPQDLLPVLARRIRLGGRLVFSCLTRSPGMPEGRRQMLVRTGPARSMWTVRHMYSVSGWVRLLAEHGFTTDRVVRPTDPVNAFWGACVFAAHRYR
ncbi:class I SAM-dependent methyltransferase [Streptomyces sp. NBC_00354]|uniref:class I SAM-dependent methyltransferase n=1 Tax=Streptomyces sp. NBC_00354 TaxID=2975723 RepID=UPI002E269B4E